MLSKYSIQNNFIHLKELFQNAKKHYKLNPHLLTTLKKVLDTGILFRYEKFYFFNLLPKIIQKRFWKKNKFL